MMDNGDQDLLGRGIAAAKQGDKTAARELLIRYIESDIDNKQAWFWLSTVVESEEDKRICLENLLTLDPNNAYARQELPLLLVEKEIADGKPDDHSIEQAITPLSPAAAILYPERLVKKWDWRDPIEVNKVEFTPIQSTSQYDDVWEGEADLCAYCAAEVSGGDKRCSTCKRRLKATQFSEPKASTNLIIFFVLVLGVGQLFFIQILADIIVGSQLATIVWHGFIFGTVIILAILLAIRHPVGYVGTILLLLIILTVLIFEWLADVRVDQIIQRGLTDDFFVAMAEAPFITLITPALDFIRPFQAITIILALLYGILSVGPDFEKRSVRLLARVDNGLFEAYDYFAAGRRYSEHGMWASAVLHFRRAVAKEPNRPSFQRSLGLAYAQLGFYERAADVLESARSISNDLEFKTTIQEDLHYIGSLAEKSSFKQSSENKP